MSPYTISEDSRKGVKVLVKRLNIFLSILAQVSLITKVDKFLSIYMMSAKKDYLGLNLLRWLAADLPLDFNKEFICVSAALRKIESSDNRDKHWYL